MNPPAPAGSPALRRTDHALLGLALSALLVLLWDGTRLDLALAHWFGSAQGFPLRSDWLFSRLLHDDLRIGAWLLATALIVGVWLPWGPLRRIDLGRRSAMAVALLLSLGIVVGIKGLSRTSCPWDLAEFGGVARYVSHWQWGLSDGGSGHCFPGGHASAGFAFISVYFALRDAAPRLARLCLAAALASGLALGWVQQARGAHFMSHTFWTAWLCFTTAWAVDAVRQRLCDRRDSGAGRGLAQGKS